MQGCDAVSIKKYYATLHGVPIIVIINSIEKCWERATSDEFISAFRTTRINIIIKLQQDININSKIIIIYY